MISSRNWASDLPRMLQSQETESVHLDYKAGAALLPPSQGGTGINKQKRAADISKDVTAFLNSDGGALVYGVREERKSGGAPVPLFDPKKDGFAAGEVSKEEIEDIVTSNIQYRPGPDLFTVVEVPMSNRNVYVIEIAKSMVGAFQANDKKYYKRFNFKSEPMEHYEIEDVRNRGIGPQLDLLMGLTSTWSQESEIEVKAGSTLPVSVHFGVRNKGLAPQR